MKTYCLFCIAALGGLLMGGCAGAGQDVAETPVGSVIAGDTHTPDDYLERVRQQNRSNTREAGVNQTQFQSHEHTNFGTGNQRY